MSAPSESTPPVSNETANAQQSPQPEQKTVASPPEEKKNVKPVIGIDFGTQRVVVAIATQEQDFLPKIIQNNLSNDQTPNVVSFKGDERMIGEEALNQIVSAPKGTVTSVKRILGRDISDNNFNHEVQRYPYGIRRTESQTIVEVNYRNENVQFTPELIAAMLLNKVKWFIEKKEGPTERCVIAIPPAFTNAQRAAIIDAAKIAGWEVMGVVHDITAASLCYGMRQKFEEGTKKTVMLLDMGHSYFTAQIVQFSKDKLEVLGTTSDESLGARVFDYALFDHASAQFKKKNNLDVSTNPKALCRLLNTSEKTKQVLSTIPETDLTVDCLMNDFDLSMNVSRKTLEEASRPYLDKLGTILTSLLEKCNLKLEQIDAVELIGGGMRIPIVQDKIKKTLVDKELRFSLDSAHCIALGAALMGKILDPDFKFGYVVIDDLNDNTGVKSRFTDEEIKQAQKKNEELVENDKLIAKKKDAKNAIEAYIYNTRSQCSDSKFNEIILANQRPVIQKLLDDAENWLWSDGNNLELTALEEKLSKLKEEVGQASPLLAEHIKKEEEARKKALEEAEEYIKTHKNPTSTKDKREPRTNPEKIEAAMKRKNQGNTCFKDGAVEDAVTRYTQGLAYFDQIYDLSPEQQKEVNDLKLQCHSNLSMCYLKLQKYENARDSCTKALEIDSQNVKVLFRRGQANYYLKELEKAKDDLTNAAKLDPKNNDVRKILTTVQDKLKEQNEKEKKMYAKMFG